MKYFDTKKDSLEEAISKAINEKPEQLKEEVVAKDLLEAGGKYLKYSDLLLQKGRLMQQGKNTAMIDKEISKEMKKLGIKEATGDKEKYQKFFQSALKKFGVDSPADFKDDAKKKEFFNYIDKNYKGDHEEEVDLEEEDIKIIMDKDVSNRDFQKLMKKFKLKVKETGEYNQGYAEVEISGDKRDMEKMMKVTRDSLSNYKFNSRTKTYESNNLEAKTTKNVDETLDRIREANVEKQKSMRSILADIWKMNEGKSPFEKDEGFASDAQRKAAFASGYKAKGKKGKKEEIEKSSKTATGQKPTKVEIEPEVKWMKDIRELLKVNEESLPKIYCDMDQVLCAFIDGASKVIGSDFRKANRDTRWKVISNTKGFWEKLDWMPGAKRLYQRISKYDPYILSAYSDRDVNSKPGKYKWIQKNTRIPKSRVLLVKRAQKQAYSTENGQPSVLVDDYIKNIKEWENKGGIGVHHTDVSKTLKELTNLGYK